MAASIRLLEERIDAGLRHGSESDQSVMINHRRQHKLRLLEYLPTAYQMAFRSPAGGRNRESRSAAVDQVEHGWALLQHLGSDCQRGLVVLGTTVANPDDDASGRNGIRQLSCGCRNGIGS